MDHNEHVMEGPLGKALANKEELDLSEAINLHTGDGPGETLFRGSGPIDGLWVSSDLDISKIWCGRSSSFHTGHSIGVVCGHESS